MKSFLPFFVLLAFSYTAKSQLVITDTANCYDVTLHATFTGITPINSLLYSDDSYSGVLPIGFTFNYYGTPSTQFIIGENGVICFDLGLAGGGIGWSITAPLLGNTSVLDCICGPWCDIEGIATMPYQPIYYSTQGVAPNRSLAVTWCGVDMFECNTQWTTTQIIIYETTNIVEVHIGHKTVCTTWNGGYAICGVQNASGTAATVAPGRDYPSVWTAFGESWRFTPAGTTSFTVGSIPYAPIPYSYSAIYWYDSTTGAYIDTGSTITIPISAPTTYKAAVVGCDDTEWAYIHVIPTCVTNNNPCVGDSLGLLLLNDTGTVETYLWTGPGGFTSTLKNTYIYPATFADSGWYYLIRTSGGIHDTDSTHVVIHPLPTMTVGSNSPLCADAIDTLNLSATPSSPGETFSWTGPGGFTSSSEFPTVTGFTPPTIGLGVYTVVATTSFGCKDTATLVVDTITRPSAPVISGITPYCQGVTFVPFTTVPAASATVSILWYPLGPGGGVITGVPSTVYTAIPGYDTVWATQKIGSCESLPGSFVTRVITTPHAPVVSGSQYCQYIGPIVDLSPTHTPTGVIWWYGAATGGDSTLIEPLPNINVAGVYPYYVGQTDSSCPSTRTEVTITVHPKPDTPVINEPYLYCQFNTPASVLATASGTGDLLLWYGPGVTVGTPPPGPVPQTDTPGVTNYYVTETSSFGCVSDSSLDAVHVTIKPQPPLVRDIKYCQLAQSVPPLNGSVDSAGGSTLYWYYNTIALPEAPIPPTDTTAGNYTWYVGQTILGCPSDSIPITVTIIYKPVFQIAATQPYVCQFDSITMSYMGPGLFAPGYSWTLPEGAYFADGTHSYDSTVIIKFDTATLNNYVHLTTSDDSGFCTSDTSIRIRIVVQPVAIPQTKPDVCLGDTVALSLSGSSSDAFNYTWLIDNVLMNQSLALNILASSSNSGGPYSISWLDSGRHIIVVESFSQEGCRSLPWYDTINVHTVPDAGFQLSPDTKQPLCLEDSVLFIARETGYNYSYQWSPGHSFNNENTSTIWGRVEQEQSIITLTVTDPFGCVATSSMEIDPATCCMVSFPNAFTPNGDHDNDFFRPITSGYHKFHVFRVANRWGQTVFESSDDTPQWDGNYNGVPQDMGTYFYYLKYDCGGKTLEQKGDITLIR